MGPSGVSHRAVWGPGFGSAHGAPHGASQPRVLGCQPCLMVTAMSGTQCWRLSSSEVAHGLQHVLTLSVRTPGDST